MSLNLGKPLDPIKNPPHHTDHNQPSRVCPFLDTTSYQCDSVNLSDGEARAYWLQCILEMLKLFEAQASESERNAGNAAEQKANTFFETTRAQLIRLSREDFPAFSIRRMLDLIQDSLKLHGFEDPWREKKRLENTKALGEFERRLQSVDGIRDPDAKWTELIKGVLAGDILRRAKKC